MNITPSYFPVTFAPHGPSYCFEPRFIPADPHRVVRAVGDIAPQFRLVAGDPTEVAHYRYGFVAHARQARSDGSLTIVAVHVEHHPQGAVVAFGALDPTPQGPSVASLLPHLMPIVCGLIGLIVIWAFEIHYARLALGFCVSVGLGAGAMLRGEERPTPLSVAQDPSSDERRFARALLAALEARLSR